MLLLGKFNYGSYFDIFFYGKVRLRIGEKWPVWERAQIVEDRDRKNVIIMEIKGRSGYICILFIK